MPNWCWNNLEVHGDEIQLREFVEKSTTNIERDDEFSFNEWELHPTFRN